MIQVSISGSDDEIRAMKQSLGERLTGFGWAPSNGNDSTYSCVHGNAALLSIKSEPTELFVTTPGEATCSCLQSLAQTVASIPFTESELEVIRRQMPLTSGAIDWMDVGDSKPLAGLGGIFTIHHQRDFVVMLETALRLGMQAEDVLVIDKEYKYLYRHRVDGHIRHVLGAEVARYSEMTEAVIDFLERLRSRWKRAIVLDDGGYVLPVLHGRAPHLLQFIHGVVEQTASGIDALRPLEPDLRVPLFDVAESDLKQTVEARGVAAAGFRSLRSVLPDIHWNGRRAIVAGYGRIGRALAQELNKESVQVAVVEKDYAQLVTAQEDGFTAFDSLERAVTEWGPDLFFGATGRAGFGPGIIENLQRDCVLVSMTSRDFEFDKEYLSKTASHTAAVERVGTNYTCHGESGEFTVLLVADGFPVNFFHSESMPNEQSDLVLASMLLGAVELVRSRDRFAIGFNQGVSNDLINDHNLLRIYFNLRGQPPRLG